MNIPIKCTPDPLALQFAVELANALMAGDAYRRDSVSITVVAGDSSDAGGVSIGSPIMSTPVMKAAHNGTHAP
jgi:hypothetical protein